MGNLIGTDLCNLVQIGIVLVCCMLIGKKCTEKVYKLVTMNIVFQKKKICINKKITENYKKNNYNTFFTNKWWMSGGVKVALHPWLYDPVTASKPNCSYFYSWIKSTRAEKFPGKFVVHLFIFFNRF